MTPHRDKRKAKEGEGSRTRGTYVLDRTFPHVGRIKRACGTPHLKTYRQLNEMLTVLHNMGRLDLLRAVRDGKLKPLAVYDAYRVGELERLPSVETLGGLKLALEEFVETVVAGDRHRSSLGTSVKHLIAAAPKGATVADLPDALRKLRGKLNEHPRAFNLARSAAQAFVRERFGRRSRLWLEVSNVEALGEQVTRRGHPITPKELEAVCAKLPADVAAMAWSIAASGMGPAEYWERGGAWWRDEGTHIHVRGTKRDGRDRNVPRFRELARPACWEGKFREHLAKASDGAVQPYDLRRSFAHWMELARIPRTRRRLYMGHGKRDVTDLYEYHDVVTFLADDATLIRSWISEQLAASETKVLPLTRTAGESA